VQAKTDAEGGEVTSDQLWAIFRDEYLPAEDPNEKWGRFELIRTRTSSDLGGVVDLDVRLRVDETVVDESTRGNGPVDAFLKVMDRQGFSISLYDYVEHAMSAGGDAKAAAYVDLEVNGVRLWGVGVDADIATASLKAIVSSVNRAVRADVPQLALA
jgi:2-isopropylmalate synthase